MAQQKDIKKTFCTTREAAEMLGLSLRTAQLWSENGLLEVWKTEGGHRRISRASIERLLSRPTTHKESINESPLVPDMATVHLVAPDSFNIMVVDDDPTLLQLYVAKLSRWPMKPIIHTASDGYTGLIQLGHIKPDLLIADLHMPGMDGFRMVNTIRSVPTLASISIIIVTGLNMDVFAGKGIVPDDILILPKPIPFDRLRAFAEQMLRKRNELA